MMIEEGIVPVRHYQVYGERCSGTNYIIRLLERNVESAQFTEAFGHKHWYVERAHTIPASCLVLVVARNPYDWLRSFHRKPWHVVPEIARQPFSQFIRSEWVGGLTVNGEGEEPARERHPITGRRFKNVLELRRVKLEHWAGIEHLGYFPLLRVGYEAVFRNPTLFLERLCGTFDLRMRNAFVPVSTYKGEITHEFVPRQYPPISPADVRFIRSQLCTQTEDAWFGKFACTSAEQPITDSVMAMTGR